MIRPEIPAAATLGRRTPAFTADTVPAGLLRAHETSAWAELIVTRGSVLFIEDASAHRHQARPGSPVVIVPGRRHHVEPDESAQFHVQFFDLPQTIDDADGAST